MGVLATGPHSKRVIAARSVNAGPLVPKPPERTMLMR